MGNIADIFVIGEEKIGYVFVFLRENIF